MSLRILLICSMFVVASLTSLGHLAAQGIDQLQAMALTSKAFRSAAEKVKPQLVTIESFGGVSAVQGRIGGIRNQGEGNTTGLLISKEGHIVTSTFNFIQSPPIITVITGDGERRVAKLLGKDEIRKLCVLKIESYPGIELPEFCLLYTSPSPRDATLSRMPSSA